MNEIWHALVPLIRPAAALAVLAIIGLFFSFRSDYHEHPDRTRIAVKLTLSTIAHVMTLGRMRKAELPDRRHNPHPRRHTPAEMDLGTISAPITPDPRTTPKRGHHKRDHQETDE